MDGVQPPEAESNEDRSAVVCDSPTSTSTQQELAGRWCLAVPRFSLHQQSDLGVILDSEMSFRLYVNQQYQSVVVLPAQMCQELR